MNLNLFENLKNSIEENTFVKNFIEELSDFLSNITSSKAQSTTNEKKEDTEISNKISPIKEISLNQEDKKLQELRKEGHLYFVTEDRNNEIYLWDFTDKPKYEFKEIVSSEELLNVAKEGAMLQYKNGKYELYSPYGYDMLFNEKNDGEIKK